MAKLLASSGHGIYRVNLVEVGRDFIERVIDIVSFLFFVFLALVGIYALIDAHRVEASAQLDSEVANIASEINTEKEPYIKLTEDFLE